MRPILKKQRAAGRFGSVYLLYVCALLTGAVAALLTAILFTATDNAGKERAELMGVYWSQYISFLVEKGETASLDQILLQDAPFYPQQAGFRLTLKDKSGSSIATYSSLPELKRPLHRVEKPYLDAGKIGGTVVVEVPLTDRPSAWPRLIATGTLVALVAGGAMLFQRRLWRRRLALWADYIQAAVPQGEFSAENKHTSPVNSNLLPTSQTPEEKQLYAAIGRSSALILQLQTARKTMVAEVAHELRTPLTVVRAGLDNALYENKPLPPERLAVLSEQITAMSSLVQDLQDLTLAESGSLRLEKSWFTPGGTVSSLVELFEPDAEDKGIAIRAELDEAAKLYADERRFRQLVLNLLGNAIRHARSRIDVSLLVAQSSLLLTVQDDGWGMEPEEAQELFQRYYRKRTYADGSPAPRGVGLGLAVVKGIAEAHGGCASVASRFGEGAAFTVKLPLFRE